MVRWLMVGYRGWMECVGVWCGMDYYGGGYREGGWLVRVVDWWWEVVVRWVVKVRFVAGGEKQHRC